MIPLEIERKFLIEQSDELKEKCHEKIRIVQTYLKSADPSLQRRVRSWETEDKSVFFYTEKRFLTAVTREENESEISEEEYKRLILEADTDLKPVIKTRMILAYENQRFEIDVYPFSDSLAIMEIELPNEDADIIFPPFVSIIKEVTGVKEYSNANIALSGKLER